MALTCVTTTMKIVTTARVSSLAKETLSRIWFNPHLGRKAFMATSVIRSCDWVGTTHEEDDEEKPCFIVNFPNVAPFRLSTDRDDPRSLVKSFMQRGLGVADPSRIMVSSCWFRNPEFTKQGVSPVSQDTSSGTGRISRPGYDAGEPSVQRDISILFRLYHTEDAKTIWDLYNMERGSLANDGVYLVDVTLPNHIHKLHQTSSELLGSLEKFGRSLRFHNDGVSEGDRLYSSTRELLDSIVPHQLFIWKEYDPSGFADAAASLRVASSYRLMKMICSNLGFTEPPCKAFSGPWHAFLGTTDVLQSQHCFTVSFAKEGDKRSVVDAFYEFVRTELYDGMIRITDPTMPRETGTAHSFICKRMPTLRKAGLEIRITSSGVMIGAETFSNVKKVMRYFQRHQLFISGIPGSSSARARRNLNWRLWEELAVTGLGIPSDGLPAILDVWRIPGRSKGTPELMAVAFPTQKEKDTVLKAYPAHRWWLWDKGILIRDTAVPDNVLRLHSWVMNRLSIQHDGDDEETRAALRNLCEFIEAGVIFDGHLCESRGSFTEQLAKR